MMIGYLVDHNDVSVILLPPWKLLLDKQWVSIVINIVYPIVILNGDISFIVNKVFYYVHTIYFSCHMQSSVLKEREKTK